jgi:signal transduction histidine kinase
MRRVPLIRRLALIAVAAIVPLAAMAALGLYELAKEQRAQADRAGIEITRALVTGVDAELGRSLSVLEAMTASALLDALDLAAFHDLAQRIAATRPHWQAVILAAPDGTPLLNTELPFGTSLPPTIETVSLARSADTSSPTIGQALKGVRGNVRFPVRVPVVRDGKLRYVLTAVVKPESVLDVVRRQRLPEDWVVSVFDAAGTRVARSRMHETYVGTPASPSLKALMDEKGAEGAGMTKALEGDPIYTAFSTSPQFGWTVAIGLPQSYVEAGEARSVSVLAGGVLLSLLVAGALALWAARAITRPMRELQAAARALGDGGRPRTPQTDIEEIRAVAEALLQAERQRASAEAEREELLRREQEARGTAEAANRAKDEFLAMLGHELRNPLGAISNASRLLEMAQLPAETAAQARQIIARQVQHLARMTDDLLDAGRALTGKVALHRQPLDLAAAVEGAVATLRTRTHDHRIDVQLQEAWVDADSTRVEQVISNLLVNAVKYTPNGGHVRIGVAREGPDAVLRVSDDGIGMSADLAARAFELFVQGDRELDRAHGGLGIGLTLVRRLAELHGGSASASSRGPGLGSEFVVRLPAIDPPASPHRAHATAPARPRDILVVEDNDDARETLCRLLVLSGHRVRAAADGPAGVEAALAAPPEVALIDIGLPRLDGYEVARRIRAAEGARRPLLIALTGYGLPEDKERAEQAGFDAHLVKPVDAGALARLLEGLG